MDHRRETFQTLFDRLSTCEEQVNRAATLLWESIENKHVASIHDLIEAKTYLRKASEGDRLLLETAAYLSPSSGFEMDIKDIFRRIRIHQSRVSSYVEIAKTPSHDLHAPINREIVNMAATQVDIYVLNKALKTVLEALTSTHPTNRENGRPQEPA